MRSLLFLFVTLPLLADPALDALGRLLPPSCNRITGVSGEALRRVPSPAFYLMAGDSAGGGFGDLIIRAGFEPKRDMAEFVSCGQYPDLVIVRGTFDRQRFGYLDRMQGERKEIIYRDFPVSMIESGKEEPPLWTALVREHVIIGSPHQVQASIDRLPGGAPDPPFLREIERARERFDVWVLSTEPGFARHEIGHGSGLGESAAQPFERTRGFTAGLTLSGSPTVLLEVRAANEADARSMATVIRLVLAAKRQEMPAPFQSALDRLTIWPAGDTVSASYTTTLADFEQLLLVAKQH